MTLQRLYLETMEDILKSSNKVIIDKAAEGQTGVLPYLPLPSLPPFSPAPGEATPPAAAPPPASPSSGRRP